MRRSYAKFAGVLVLFCGIVALGQPGGSDAEPPPALLASDDLASAEAFVEVPIGPVGLLDRFSATIEVRADSSVRIDRWSVEDALGDQVLVTVVDSQPLARGELGGWYGRYEVMVEPLVDGEITIGPLTLTYLIDPDREADPTQLEPERVRLSSDSFMILIAGSGGALPDSPHPAKEVARPEEPFDWQALLIAGAAVGVVAPIVTALVLAVRTTRRRTRNESPQRCIEQLDALDRVVRAASPSGMAVDGPAVATETLTSVRTMLDESLGLRCSAMSGPELLKSRELRGVLSADAFDHLRTLVERTESVRFAGGTLDEPEAHDLIACARRLAMAVEVQQGGRVGRGGPA